MKKSLLIAVLALVGLMTLPVSADLSGTTNLRDTDDNTLEGIVDWAVIDTVESTNALYTKYLGEGGVELTEGTYLYLYQVTFIEKDMSRFSVSPIGHAPITGVLSAGYTNDSGIEVEPYHVTTVGSVSWSFDPVVVSGEKSSVLWYTSNYKSTTGEGLLQDGVQAKGAVPVPVPAPAALLLGGMGLGLVGWLKRLFA